jgi:hypothetical protein
MPMGVQCCRHPEELKLKPIDKVGGVCQAIFSHEIVPSIASSLHSEPKKVRRKKSDDKRKNEGSHDQDMLIHRRLMNCRLFGTVLVDSKVVIQTTASIILCSVFICERRALRLGGPGAFSGQRIRDQ